MADFLCPKVIFRHVDKPAKRTDAPWRGYFPTSLFHDFTMEGRDWRLIGIYTSSWQLKIRCRIVLAGQQQLTITGQ